MDKPENKWWTKKTEGLEMMKKNCYKNEKIYYGKNTKVAVS